jgi:hypothetical protein
MHTLFNTLKNVIFWSHARGTIPYDLLCALILIFIFLTPSSFFHDWPKLNTPQQFQMGKSIVLSRDEMGATVYNVLTPPNASQVPVALENQLKTSLDQYLKRPVTIYRLQPIYAGGGEVAGYSVWINSAPKN